MFSLSIRAKLTLWYLVILGGLLCFFSLFLYLTLEKKLKENFDHKLRSTAYVIRSSVMEPFPTGPSLADVERIMREHFGFKPIGRFIQLFDETGKKASNIKEMEIPLSLKTLESLSKGEEVFENVTLKDGTVLRVLSVPIIVNGKMLGVVQVGSPFDQIRETLRELLLILLILVPLALMGASLGGLFLAEKALRPIARITKTAQMIASGDLSQRIPSEGLPQDEMGNLVNTFNHMISKLQKLFDETKRFTADASHELKTPLSILQSEIEFGLKRPRSPEEYQEILRSCLEEIRRMSKILNGLLTLARADAGAIRLKDEVVDVGEVAQGVWKNFFKVAKENGLEFYFQGESVKVRGDRDYLKQLIVNLVDNALKYTPSGGYIRLSTSAQNGVALIEIEDTGEGIPEEDQERIFDRFFRVDKARSREKGGAGLGLSICKWIVQAHGGEISLKSALGQGTTFTVKLPLFKVPLD
jgi:heavy metal sensor kinase